MKLPLTPYTAATLLLLASCGKQPKAYDATGTFETTEITVSAEQSGRLLQLSVEEGTPVEAGRQVALTDTTQYYLKAQLAGAAKNVYAAQRPEIEKQVAATRQQLAKAEQEQARFEALVADGAAYGKQLDDARNEVKVLRRQLEAQESSLHTSTRSLNASMSQTDVEAASAADMLRKCHIASPISGIVLEKYAEPGEYAAPGKPLFKVADTSLMYLRAYVTSLQLQHVRIGQAVKVFADYGDGKRKAYDGKVSWISAKSEFTPKTILTDDERADLVYAVKIAVRNDGFIKIGMYGEVKF